MTPATLAALLPLIEAALKEAPAIIGDIEAIIARVRGGSATTIGPVDATKAMSAVAAELAKYK